MDLKNHPYRRKIEIRIEWKRNETSHVITVRICYKLIAVNVFKMAQMVILILFLPGLKSSRLGKITHRESYIFQRLRKNNRIFWNFLAFLSKITLLDIYNCTNSDRNLIKIITYVILGTFTMINLYQIMAVVTCEDSFLFHSILISIFLRYRWFFMFTARFYSYPDQYYASK